MKKTVTAVMCATLALLAPGCAETKETALRPGVYILQDVKRDVPGDFTISIYDDGTFQYYETPISSYIGMGHYSIENDVVVLKEDEAGCTGDINYYQMSDGSLKFIFGDSANYRYVPLEDGAVFVRTSDVQERFGR